MRLYLISDNVDTQVGLRLAGIDGVVVHKRHHVLHALENAARDEEIGIILITEKLSELCSDEILKLKQTCEKPLIVEIPDRHGSGRGEDSITRYVRDAIGIKI